jgi:excisionase family DNA binding protein
MPNHTQDPAETLRTRLTLTVKEAAAALSVSPETCYRWIREGRLPGALRLSQGSVRIQSAALLAIIEGREEMPDVAETE